MLAAAALLMQTPEGGEPLRLLARTASDDRLVAEARAQPLLVREAVSRALAKAARSPDKAEEELGLARRLAAAHAVAWGDPFLVREVSRFRQWPPERRGAKVEADSLRKAGVADYGRHGPGAAIRIWYRALARSAAIPDTAGVGAALGNLGAAFLDEEALDSAAVYLERARLLASKVGDLRVEANAIGALADLSERAGDLEVARERYGAALALRQRIGDVGGVAATYNSLGLLAQNAGELDEARRQFEAALALNRRHLRDEGTAANLVNLAGLSVLDGHFARARDLYLDALAIWQSRERWADAASALHGLGQLEVRRGDYVAALASLRQAMAIYQRTGPVAALLGVRRDLAGALAGAGRLQEAMDILTHSQRLADSSRVDSGSRGWLSMARADLAVRLNALSEAERLYREAEARFREAADAGGRSDAQHGLGLLYLERNDYRRAYDLFQAAFRVQVEEGNRRGAALTRVSLGHLAAMQGAIATARTELGRAAAELDQLGDPVAAAMALGVHADLIGDSLPGAAESLYRDGLRRVSGLVAPEIVAGLHAGLGRVYRSQGALDDAARELRAAVATLERPGMSLTLPERRSGFFADKWQPYLDLALVERERDRPAAAFETSERLRAREMLGLLGLARLAPPRDTAADLVMREQDLRRRIAELSEQPGRPVSGLGQLRGPNLSLAPRDVWKGLAAAQEAYAELLLEIRERVPSHAAMVAPEPVSPQQVSRQLGTDQALIEYLVTDSTTLAFVITRETTAVVDLGLGRRELARLVGFSRGTLEQSISAPAESLWRAPLRRLHQHLLAPLEERGLLSGKTRLVVVPHAELHYLPFAALINRETGAYLVERYEVTVIPSASVWLALADRPSRRRAGLLAMAPVVNALPGTRQETAAIRRLTGGAARVLDGAAASEDAFRREAPGASIIHLATYGVLNKQNPLFSFVELAPGGPYDGRLEAHEVFGLRLVADVVVLSACQTGLASGARADVPAGDDWVGLSRAFLHAGAANVVATLWAVDDLPTATLMVAFYRELLSGTDPGRSLARAQRAMLADQTTSHPYRWAGFVVVGGSR